MIALTEFEIDIVTGGQEGGPGDFSDIAKEIADGVPPTEFPKLPGQMEC